MSASTKPAILRAYSYPGLDKATFLADLADARASLQQEG